MSKDAEEANRHRAVERPHQFRVLADGDIEPSAWLDYAYGWGDFQPEDRVSVWDIWQGNALDITTAGNKRRRLRFKETGAYRRLYRTFLRLIYYGLAPLSSFFMRFRKPPTDRPPRVLRIISVATQGGVAKVVLQTLLHMKPESAANTLLVFAEKRASTASLEERPDICLISRRLELWPCSYEMMYFRSLFRLARFLWKIRPDIIHMHEPQFAPTARIAAALAGGIPAVVHLHSDYRERDNSIHHELRGLHKHALRRVHLATCSQAIYDAACDWLGPRRLPMVLVPDGADDIPDSEPEPDLLEKLRRAAGDRIVIAKMARIIPSKRIPDFLAACRILLDEGHRIFVLLMCYGKIKHGKRLWPLFNEQFAPDQGELLFKVLAPQHLLQRVDIGVSASSLEGLGLNVLEYQMQGLPVVCADIPAHREMVDDGETGLLFPPGDVPALVRSLRRLILDAETRRRLGAAGLESASRRTWTETADRTLRFYHEEVLRRDERQR